MGPVQAERSAKREVAVAWSDWRVGYAVLGLACVAAFFIFALTPFVHDLPLMHFIAWRVGAGEAPYVDLWDMNGPMTYMVHALLMAIPLPAAMANALVMTALTAACVASAVIVAGRSGRRWLGIAAGAAVLAWIVGRGSDYLMQRDMIIAVCAAAALALAHGAQAWRWAVAGLLIGLAVGVKPTAAPFALVLLAMAAWVDLGEGRRFTRTLWLALGGAAGGLVWFAYLVATGSLAAWWSIMSDYNAAYMKIARQPLMTLLAEPAVLLAAVATVLCGGVAWLRAKAGAAREEIAGLIAAGAFAACAGLAYVLQGKGWSYQTAPAGVLALIAIGAAVATPLALPRRGVAVVCALVGAYVGVLSLGGIRQQMSEPFHAYQAERQAFVADMTEALEALPAGMKVQPLDTTDGALHAMLEARRAEASPVIYDFWLFTGTDAGMAKSRAAVLKAVQTGNAAVLMTDLGWPEMASGFARMREFKEFQDILDQRYTLVSEGRRGRHGYRLFAPS